MEVMTPGWELGKWLVICDRCGFKKTNDQVRKEWTGLIVCADTCWEPRHPQEFVRPRPDEQKVAFTRPEPTDVELAVPALDAEYLDLPGTSDNYASTPDSVAASVTGDIDISMKLAATDWTPAVTNTLIAKGDWDLISADYAINLFTSGVLRFLFGNSASTFLNIDSTVPTGFTDGTVHWIRATRVQATGVVTFYTSDDGETWTTLGDTVVLSAGIAINDSVNPLLIGNYMSNGGAGVQPTNGNIYYAEVRNGIGGSVVAKFDPVNDGANVGDTEFTSSTGEVWTINQSGDPQAELTRAVLPATGFDSTSTFDNSL